MGDQPSYVPDEEEPADDWLTDYENDPYAQNDVDDVEAE